MVQKRRYTASQKLATVMAAETTSLTETAEVTGIPKSTIFHWMKDPEMEQARTKARETMGEVAGLVGYLAWASLGQMIVDGKVEPRDLAFTAKAATELHILMTGGATARTESRDLTGTLSDGDVRDAIREAYRLTGANRVAEAPEGAPEG